MSRVVRALPVLDQLSTPDGSVVLVAEGNTARVARVSKLGSAVLELTAAGMPLSELTKHLTHRFGAPSGEPADVVRSLVEELARQRLVEWVTDELD